MGNVTATRSRSSLADEAAWILQQHQQQLEEGATAQLPEECHHVLTTPLSPRCSDARIESHIQQLHTMLQLGTDLGSEPGIDAKHPENCDYRPEQVISRSRITCTDYSNTQITSTTNIGNADLQSFLDTPRPTWSKVRWVMVEGSSFDVLKILAEHYNIHPLAFEDAAQVPQRVKTDFYEEHLYVSMVLLALDHPRTDAAALRTPLWAGSNDNPMSRPAGLLVGEKEVFVEQANLFLFRDGTVISIFQNEAPPALKRTLERLHTHRGTLLRKTEDPSFLLHRVLDAVVDGAMPVINHYVQQITQIERAVLEGELSASLTRNLHLLQSELNLLKRALVPAQLMVANMKLKDAEFSEGNAEQHWLSRLTRTYLEDVHDHTISGVENIETSIIRARDLIDLIFNSISHKTSHSMQTLAVVSTIFLPITFLAGVYGTNFNNIPEYQWEHGYMYFWILCVACSALVVFVINRLGLRFSYGV